MMRLKPSERLMLMSLRITPNQTIEQLIAACGINQRHHGLNTIRVLLALNLVHASETTPIIYSLTEVSHV